MAKLPVTSNVPAAIDYNYFENVESSSCSNAFLILLLHFAYYTTWSTSLKAETQA